MRSVLGRSSLPPPTPAARAAVDLATRRLADRAGRDLPTPWAEAVERAASPAGRLPRGRLGPGGRRHLAPRAVAGLVARRRGRPARSSPSTAVVGLLWLALYVVLGWLQLDPIVGDPPTWGVLPVPLVLLVGGVLGGLFLALVSRWLARIGARRRGRVMDKRLRASIDAVAEAEIIVPVELVLERHARDARRTDPRGGRLTPPARRAALLHRSGMPCIPSTGRRRFSRRRRSVRRLGPGPRGTGPGGRDTMNETYVTIKGRLVADPTVRTTRAGAPMTSFRIASSVRRPVAGQPGVWADAETSFYDVVTYRALAANVGVSVRKGHPVTIHGRQHIVSRARDDGTTWWGVEVVADAVGHDLSYGTAAFARVSRGQFSDSDRTAVPDAPETFAHVGLGDPEHDPYVVEGAPATQPPARSPLRRVTATARTVRTPVRWSPPRRSPPPDEARRPAPPAVRRIRGVGVLVVSLAPCPSSSTSCRVPARPTATRSSSTTSPCPSSPAPRSASSVRTALGSPRS